MEIRPFFIHVNLGGFLKFSLLIFQGQVFTCKVVVQQKRLWFYNSITIVIAIIIARGDSYAQDLTHLDMWYGDAADMINYNFENISHPSLITHHNRWVNLDNI